MQTRPRRLRRGFWAGSSSRPKSAPKKRGGLNKKEIKQTKEIAKTVVKSRKEKKYSNSWFSYDDHDPVLIGGLLQPRIIAAAALPNVYNPAVNSCTTVCFQTGNYLNSASTDLNAAFPIGVPAIFPLGGYSYEEGTGQDERVGDYAFFANSFITLDIRAEVSQGNAAGSQGSLFPLEFRVLHLSMRKDAAGVIPSLTSQLLLNLQNQQEGMNSAMTTKEISQDYIVNGARFKKLKEIRFKLNQPVSPNYVQGGTSTSAYQNSPQSHPFTKKLRLNCPMPKKKIRFSDIDNGVNNAFEPLNADTVTFVIILCTRNAPYNTTNITDFNDTGKDWSVTATGQTTIRDA